MLCQHGWQKTSFQVKVIRKQHFKPIHAQMEHEEEGKITIKDIPELMDMFMHISMCKHFSDFETYLSQNYEVDGFPLIMLFTQS